MEVWVEDNGHSAFQNGHSFIMKESRKVKKWLFGFLLCVLAVAVWGDYVLSRNPTATRSIHNAHYIIYLPDIFCIHKEYSHD